MPATPEPMSIFHEAAATPRRVERAKPRPAPGMSEEALAREMRIAAARECAGPVETVNEVYQRNGAKGGRPPKFDPAAATAPGIIRDLIFSASRPVGRAAAMKAAGCTKWTYEKIMRDMRAAGEVEYDPARHGWLRAHGAEGNP